MAKTQIEVLEQQQSVIAKALETEKEKKEIEKQKIEVEQKLKASEVNLKKVIEKAKKGKPESFELEKWKEPEKKSLFKPTTWFSADKTNPVILIILSPAGDLTIRQRVADQRGNLSLGKNTLYRIEHREIWDIADSEVDGFRGKRILFYFQDNPNPIRIRRDDTQVKVTVNTETYAKSQKSHLLSELLSPDLKFSDYLTMIMIGISILLSLVIIVKLFFLNKGGA